MWISVSPVNQTQEQKKIGVQPYAVDLKLTDRMVRLGIFTGGVFAGPEGEPRYHAKSMYKNNETLVFKSAEDAADAIAEYQMGREISAMIPVHLTPDTPD